MSVRLVLVAACAGIAGCPETASDPTLGGEGVDSAVDSASSNPEASPVDAARDAGPADDSGVDAAAPDAAPGFQPQIDLTCPGSAGCEAVPDTTLRVGASAQLVSDIGFERPLLEYLERRDDCNEFQGERCGQLDRDFLRNCGTDRLCEGDEGYPGPDADGSEGDRDEDDRPYYDYFRDCGIDDLCPGEEGYTEPDEGEGDKHFDGLWVAGFGLNRPAVGVRDGAWARTVAVAAIDPVGVEPGQDTKTKPSTSEKKK